MLGKSLGDLLLNISLQKSCSSVALLERLNTCNVIRMESKFFDSVGRPSIKGGNNNVKQEKNVLLQQPIGYIDYVEKNRIYISSTVTLFKNQL